MSGISVTAFSEEATVERIIYLGFEVRAGLSLSDGRHIVAQLTRQEAAALELTSGQRVYVSLQDPKVFEAPEVQKLAV